MDNDMIQNANAIVGELMAASRPEKIALLGSFFKSGKGQYGEGDQFIGVTVPDNRKVARRHLDATPGVLRHLLRSPLHEVRLCALLILVEQYKRADERRRGEMFDFYLSVTDRINNWDLVDLSAPYVVGWHLSGSDDKSVLYGMASSASLWERRIAIVSTLWFVRNGEHDDALRLSGMLLGDGHDLIRKACGWVLREVGKKDKRRLVDFLDSHCEELSRTTLRYAIERFDKDERDAFMKRGRRSAGGQRS